MQHKFFVRVRLLCAILRAISSACCFKDSSNILLNRIKFFVYQRYNFCYFVEIFRKVLLLATNFFNATWERVLMEE